MAHYALACAKARTDSLTEARAGVLLTTALNSDLAHNAARDPDLAQVPALPDWPAQTR